MTPSMKLSSALLRTCSAPRLSVLLKVTAALSPPAMVTVWKSCGVYASEFISVTVYLPGIRPVTSIVPSLPVRTRSE